MAIIQNRGNMVFFGGKIEALYSVWYRTIYQYKDLLAFWKRPGHFDNISEQRDYGYFSNILKQIRFDCFSLVANHFESLP